MEGNDNNGHDAGSNGKGWTWQPGTRTWILIGTFILSLVPFMLRACGVKPTRTELPPVNTGYDPNSESQKRSADAMKELSNLMNQMNANRQSSNSDRTNSRPKATPKR